MAQIRLRAVRAEDLALLAPQSEQNDPFGFYGFRATNVIERRFADNGLISDDVGQLIVESERGEVLGVVGWFAKQHGPAVTARAYNIGITLLPAHRGKGYGTAAQRALADYLF